MQSSPLTGVNQRIKQHRFADVTLHLTRPDGRPLSGAEVAVEQTAHSFLFGLAGGIVLSPIARLLGWTDEQVEVCKERITEFANFITLPFYWGRFEPEEGAPRTEFLRETAAWFRAHGITPKGHTLCWHTACVDWLMKYPNDEILKKQRARVRREVAGFAGLVDVWDVVNEAVIMPRYDKYDNAITRIAKEYGVNELVEMLFRDARSANPRATLVLNDFILSREYEDLVDTLLKRRTPIDAVGLQTHQHQGYRGAETIWDYAERFGRFGLPLHFTENNIVSGELMPADIVDLNDYKRPDWPSTPEGEERQCEEGVEFYSLLYSHPAVEAISWWDLADGGWLNSPAGILRRDLSPKPVFLALKKLIRGEWWTGRRELKTGAQGGVRLEGAALGTYLLAAGGAKAEFRVEKNVPSVDVTLQE
ncbi:MAG: endo-1,4-beta-xylanase [Spirochaetales bacterium]|nr:endo-1,4-beta-xylanase [Spirochaetales bacterium]